MSAKYNGSKLLKTCSYIASSNCLIRLSEANLFMQILNLTFTLMNTELNVEVCRWLIQIHFSTTQKWHTSIPAHKTPLGKQSALANSNLQLHMQIQNEMPNAIASLVYSIHGSVLEMDSATVAGIAALLVGSWTSLLANTKVLSFTHLITNSRPCSLPRRLCQIPQNSTPNQLKKGQILSHMERKMLESWIH